MSESTDRYLKRLFAKQEAYHEAMGKLRNYDEYIDGKLDAVSDYVMELNLEVQALLNILFRGRDLWISIKDSMPKIDRRVMVWTPNIIDNEGEAIAVWNGEWWLLDETGNSLPNVTHWMPLPELPKEDNKDD